VPRGICRIDALGVADHRGLLASPASVLVDVGDEILVLAVGSARDVEAHEASRGATVVDRRTAVVIPGLVNAHAHLDLTHIGPLAHDPDEGFVAWVDRIRAARHDETESLARSVEEGIRLSLAGGTVAIGDIAGAPGGRQDLTPLRMLRASAMAGVSFLEYFAIGRAEEAALDRLEAFVEAHGAEVSAPGPVRGGLQPHAPNTVSLEGYRRGVDLAARFGLALATHLAETPEERAFVGEGAGAQRALLERLGIWEERILEDVGQGRSPVEHLAGVLGKGRWLVAHANDVSDRDIEVLAEAEAMVVYCPRASAYFGAHDRFGPHRYRDMLGAGITVALGTDSIVNLPEAAAIEGGGGMSVLDEMRLLHGRDGTDPRLLLAMGTVHGARALGLEASRFEIEAGGHVGGLVGVEVGRDGGADPLVAMLGSSAPASLIAGPAWGRIPA